MKSMTRLLDNSALSTVKCRRNWPSIHPSNQLIFVRVWANEHTLSQNSCVYYGRAEWSWHWWMHSVVGMKSQRFPNHKYERGLFQRASNLFLSLAGGIFMATIRPGTCHLFNKQAFACSLAVKSSTFQAFFNWCLKGVDDKSASDCKLKGTRCLATSRCSKHWRQDHKREILLSRCV